MAKNITIKGSNRHSTGSTVPELHINVWPSEYPIPNGQVEIHTTRGRSVVFSMDEWRAVVKQVEAAAKKEVA